MNKNEFIQRFTDAMEIVADKNYEKHQEFLIISEAKKKDCLFTLYNKLRTKEMTKLDMKKACIELVGYSERSINLRINNIHIFVDVTQKQLSKHTQLEKIEQVEMDKYRNQSTCRRAELLVSARQYARARVGSVAHMTKRECDNKIKACLDDFLKPKESCS